MGTPSNAELLVLLFIVLIVCLIVIFVYGPIAKKAGFSKWWSIALIVPLLNIILIWVFAFIKWPIEELQTNSSSENDDQDKKKNFNKNLVNNDGLICTNCGKQISTSDNFCPYCGEKQQII